MASRQGKHKPTKTLFGAYVEPEVKALAILVSDRTGHSFTQLILDGLTSEAIRAEVWKNGEIVPELREAYENLVEMVNASIVNKSKKEA